MYHNLIKKKQMCVCVFGWESLLSVRIEPSSFSFFFRMKDKWRVDITSQKFSFLSYICTRLKFFFSVLFQMTHTHIPNFLSIDSSYMWVCVFLYIYILKSLSFFFLCIHECLSCILHIYIYIINKCVDVPTYPSLQCFFFISINHHIF